MAATCPFSGASASADQGSQCPFSAAATNTSTAEKPQTSNQPLQPIPSVPKKYFGLLGNLPDIDPSFIQKSIWHLWDLYGDIYELDLVGNKMVVISSFDLMNEVQDDDRFQKIVSDAGFAARDFAGDGIFTAHSDERVWAQAHRILQPVFGPIAVRKMFDRMLDISSQLILRWDRLGPEHEIMTSDDFTRLAFDTIGWCTFSFRFNEFYTDDVHPFATWMGNSLSEAARRSMRTQLETKLRYFSEQKYWQDIKSMHALCDQIVEERSQNPQPDNNDLLQVMLTTPDPETGEKLSKENIRFQMTTFLIAGHETTSGTLSFLMYHLLKNPDAFHKAQQEVDEVLGDDTLTVKHLPQLKYVDACIKETLRFQGPITHIKRQAKQPTTIGGKYHIDPSTVILCNFKGNHHDPKVWGDDHDVFKPERMLDRSKIPSGAFTPFGVGIRSCIGRSFAEQEMIMCTALILQRFQLELVDPSYVMHLKPTLTVKPKDLKMRVRRRPGKSLMVGLQNISSDEKHETVKAAESSSTANGASAKPKLTVLYSSNAGTCKSYADEVVAAKSNFDVNIATLDSATEHLPTDHPVIIITPSYEGKPADNAKKFVSWLEAKKGSSDLLKGVKYAIFGVGNSEWAQTYHKVPKLIDDLMNKMGASRIMDAGFVDVKMDPVGPWEDFLEKLWPALGQTSATTDSAEELTASISQSEGAVTLGGNNISYGVVKDNIEIADSSVGPPKRHIEIELPEDVEYRTGDYLTILPYNNNDIVRRVLRHFNLQADDMVTIGATNKTYLRTPTPVSAFDLLATRVELALPVTQRQLEKLAGLTKDAKQKANLESMAKDETFQKEILPKRVSILDVLEDHPACQLSFAAYLDMLKAMTCRQYSISSSPLAPKNFGAKSLTASLTYDVHSGGEFWKSDRAFNGVASSYLANAVPGTRIHCAVRSTNAAFHLPEDLTTPVIMIAAGTGLAPMRGFIEERAAIAAAGGKKLGPALLYFGCRDYEKDYIYRQELEHWQELGAVSLRPTFSKRGPADANKAWKYVPDRMWDERNEVADLFKEGGKIFVCGSASKLAKSTADTCKKIYMERLGCSAKEADEWLDKVREDRYVSDVFG